jgi:hypothetical protein
MTRETQRELTVAWLPAERSTFRSAAKRLLLLFVYLGVAACGGGSGAPHSPAGVVAGVSPSGPAPVVTVPSVPIDKAPTAPVVTTSAGDQQLTFSWPAEEGVTSFKLTQNSVSSGGVAHVYPSVPGTATQTTLDVSVHRVDWNDARFVVTACNGVFCSDSAPIDATTISQQAITYLKASNPSPGDRFGHSLAVSGDGTIIAVGSQDESSNATGINGDQNNKLAPNAGAVYVYAKTAQGWVQQAYVKASNTKAGNLFGDDVALNFDGSVLVVGATVESSRGKGVNGDQDQSTPTTQQIGTGAAYVFRRSGTTWTQHAYLKASNAGGAQFFGHSVSVNLEGTIIAVGAWGDNSGARVVNGDQTGVAAPGSGAAYVFVGNANGWTQQAYIKASNADAGDELGLKVKLSGRGDVLAVSAVREASGAGGVNGNQADNSLPMAGAVYVFARDGDDLWAQQAYIKASNPDSLDLFGIGLAMNQSGDVLAVGAPSEGSNAEGLDGIQTDNSKIASGAVYMFTHEQSGWVQRAYIKPSNTTALPPGLYFGDGVWLSRSGTSLAVSAWGEGDQEADIGNNAGGIRADETGALYFFELPALGSWTQRNHIKAPNAQVHDNFGFRIALSADGNVLAASSPLEDSKASGVNGNRTDDTSDKEDIGAVFVY